MRDIPEAIKRSRIEVKFDVLEAIADGNTMPTRIMYRSNISWSVLDRNLAELEASHFIGFKWVSGYSDMHRTDIRVTARGLEVLREFRRIQQAIAPDEVVVWHDEVR